MDQILVQRVPLYSTSGVVVNDIGNVLIEIEKEKNLGPMKLKIATFDLS
jgi:hypothetical protein